MKIDRITRLSFSLIEAMQASHGETLAAIVVAAEATGAAKAAAGEARESANGTVHNVWALTRDLAKAVETSDTAAELDAKQLGTVLTALLTDAVEGHPVAAASVKSYASTARKAIAAVRGSKVRGWGALESKFDDEGETVEVTYADVRALLKSDDMAELDALVKAATKALRDIAGRENSTRSVASRRSDLEAILAEIGPFHVAALAAKENAKPKAKAAKAASELRQQAPSEPTVTEVTKVAATG